MRSGGYWPGPNSKLKPHNKRFSKVNPLRPSVVPEPVTLDAAKRKQLPAWIREGLEKMERDKQKQLEREREKQENNAHSDKVLLSEKDTLEIINSTVKEQKSKYVSLIFQQSSRFELSITTVLLNLFILYKILKKDL